MKHLIYSLIILAIVACNKKEIAPAQISADSTSTVIVRDTSNWYYRVYKGYNLIYEAYPTYTTDNDLNLKAYVNFTVRDGIKYNGSAYYDSTWHELKDVKIEYKFLQYYPLFGKNYSKLKGVVKKDDIVIEFKENYI